MRYIKVAALLSLMASSYTNLAWAQNVEPTLRVECRSLSQTRYDPGDIGRPLAWRDRVGEVYSTQFQPGNKGQFIGESTYIPSVGEPQIYKAGFNWDSTTLWLSEFETGEPYLLLRLVNTGAGPVYDALTLKPARSGPQLIRYTCSLTCNNRPLRNLRPEACPVPRK